MKLLTQEQIQTLMEQGLPQNRDKDMFPVVKLFTPDANATWLLVDIDPSDPDLAFGLCDLGLGFPELGYVSLQELATVRGCLGLPVERDLSFKAKYPISVYAEAAHKAEHITLNDNLLEKAVEALKRIKR